MAAYLRTTFSEFVLADPAAVVGTLQSRYAQDGFASLYIEQTQAWDASVAALQAELKAFLAIRAHAYSWGLLLEYPLYRLRKRVDAVIIAGGTIGIVEIKVGASSFRKQDERQVEEYALDLHDFHAGSRDASLIPILWCTNAPTQSVQRITSTGIAQVQRAGQGTLCGLLAELDSDNHLSVIDPGEWDNAPYRPVPSVIEAATVIFTGHSAREIATAGASNLDRAARRIVELLVQTHRDQKRALILVNGAPGAGKTLAGLQIVHDAVATGAESDGDIVYLSGNSALVTVLREALAQEEHRKHDSDSPRTTLRSIRRSVQARIQHINDFLKQYVTAARAQPPHEHVIVFDEAQRAWDEAQGKKKFGREASEPELLLEIMSRHPDWCACVCLVGTGQEINVGERGMSLWGDALRKINPDQQKRWVVYSPEKSVADSRLGAEASLGSIPESLAVINEPDLRLSVPMRSFRNPRVGEWVSAVVEGRRIRAQEVARCLGEYPIYITRSPSTAKAWLQNVARGNRRIGLLASSKARRLRADGMGELLSVSNPEAIANWYLKPQGDIRSSYALEVPANEYTAQGLELDFACVCWGGDMIYDPESGEWRFRQLSGSRWTSVKRDDQQRYIRNSYRVLLTRAREGMILWVPSGDPSDPTRDPAHLGATADFLIRCGASLSP